MGITTVAIYSDADRSSPHVRAADEAYYVGPSPSAQSYLNMDLIIEIASKNNVDGIHPGYGFLSENAEFSKKVEEAGMTFIGPKAHSIEVMGDKLAAKEAAREYNIPLLPGTKSAITDVEAAKKLADDIG